MGEAVRQFLLTLWNTYSFWVTYANASGLETGELPYVPKWTSAGEPEVTELDRWAVSRLQRTIAEVREQMEGFDCTTAAGAIADYTDELSNWYVRLNRRRFWDGDFAALETLRFCLGETAKLLAPFTPFIAEEIYANLLFGQETGLDKPVDRGRTRSPTRSTSATTRRSTSDLIDAQLEAGMDAVRRTVELGRAARAQAKVKLRQPLRKAVVVASDAEREAIERLADIVASELNVKELDFVHSEGELVSYRVKPNYRSLGPRFGKSMPQVAAAVEALDAGGVAEQLEAGAEVGIAIDGKEHTLTEDDINLVMEPLEGYQVEAEAGHAVALELDLDEELRREGLAREVVRAVQEARKQAGLDVSDRISLELGGDDELLEAAREHESYIAGETLANSVGYGVGRRGREGHDRGPRAAHRAQQGLSGAERDRRGRLRPRRRSARFRGRVGAR